MADAGPCRHPRDVSTAVRGGSSQGRRVVLPVRGAKGHGRLRRGRARRGALRGALRTVRPACVPDPTLIDTAPKPDFYFLALYALFALLPPWTETVVILVGPVLAIGALFLVPFIAGTGEKSWKRRPVAVLGVLVIVLTVTTLAGLGVAVPWSPQMEAWTAAATPVRYVKGRTPLELQGALVLQNKQCRTCHSLGGGGGRRGC